MDINKLKLYNKYKNIVEPDRKYIYIGIEDEGDYCFLIKNKDYWTPFYLLKRYCFDPDKIVNDLNLETGVYNSGDKYFNGYYFGWYKKEDIEINFKPILKDKLNNIINR